MLTRHHRMGFTFKSTPPLSPRLTTLDVLQIQEYSRLFSASEPPPGTLSCISSLPRTPGSASSASNLSLNVTSLASLLNLSSKKNYAFPLFSLEEGMATLLQYSCLENAFNRGGWRAIVHTVAKSRHNCSDLIHTHIMLYPVTLSSPPEHLLQFIITYLCVYSFACFMPLSPLEGKP